MCAARVHFWYASAAGKYTKDNLPSGARSLVINEDRVTAIQPLLSLMRDIGSAHGGKTPGQVRCGSQSVDIHKHRVIMALDVH